MAGVAAGRFMKNLRRCSAYAPSVGKFDDHMIEFNYFPQQWFLPTSRLLTHIQQCRLSGALLKHCPYCSVIFFAALAQPSCAAEVARGELQNFLDGA